MSFFDVPKLQDVRLVGEYRTVCNDMMSSNPSKNARLVAIARFIEKHYLGIDPDIRVHEFSFASAPDDNEIWFSVHVRGKGSYKQSLYKENLLSLKPGDSVELFKIKGNFLLPEEPNQHLVFIAGGLGVTPFRSMLRDIELKHLSFTVTLVHVDRGPYLYESELSQMPIEQYRVTRTEVGSTLENITKKFPKAVYYVVGSPNFAQDINDKLRPLGISSTQIKNDDWGYW